MLRVLASVLAISWLMLVEAFLTKPLLTPVWAQNQTSELALPPPAPPRPLGQRLAENSLSGPFQPLSRQESLTRIEDLSIQRRERAYGYEFQLTPTGLEALDERILRNLRVAQLERRPPLSKAGLLRRIKHDQQILKDLLRAEGFYGARVKFHVKPLTGQYRTAEGTLVQTRVGLRVKPGPQFTLRHIKLLTLDGLDRTSNEGIEFRNLREYMSESVQLDQPAKAMLVVEIEKTMRRFLAQRGYPYAKVSRQEIQVDHKDRSMALSLAVGLGPLATFGAMSVKGNQRLPAHFILEQMGLKPGQTYGLDELEKAKQRLLDTGLFTNVSLSTRSKPEAFGRVPIQVRVRERKRFKIGGGAVWNSASGPAFTLEGLDRDFLRSGNRLALALAGQEDMLEARATFEVPNFTRNLQNLTFALDGTYDERTGLLKRQAKARVTISRFYDEQKSLGQAGLVLAYHNDEIKNGLRIDNQERFLASLPISFDYDRRDQELDPKSGFRVLSSLEPSLDLKDTDIRFVNTSLLASAYQSLGTDQRLTVASWVKGEALWGEPIGSIPKSHRLYLGGSGSLRAFGEDSLKPLGQDGGLASLESGLELRFHVTPRIEVVSFLEGGQIYKNLDSLTSQNWVYGGGLGLRYDSNFGPVRADVASPIGQPWDWRNLEVSIGLGQAF